jgi:glyoxylase-like metal-dependent hydrolase (beta-lactamase superfamily II)
MMLKIEPNLLQTIPGTRGIQIYPLIRKIDLMSSNSYILSGDEQVAVIDTGALDDQLDFIVEKITSLQDAAKRPVVIYLTHSHLDHSFQLRRWKELKELGDVFVAAQELGAYALENANTELTLADLLGKKMSRIPVDIKLLSGQIVETGGKHPIRLNNANLEFFVRSLKIRQGFVFHSESILLGKDDPLEIYSIPGHSPDSICFRIGRLLIVGDLFFAPNPGMAGAYGWNQTDLLASIQKVLWILEQKNIMFCCSGHGRIVDADTAWTTLRSMYQDVISLSGIEEISPRWVKTTAEYAELLMRELERLFTIIIGRLAYISHVLDELEEGDEAESLQKLVSVTNIDELFAEFNIFVFALQKGEKLDWDLVHKAGQIIKKLDIVFENRKLGAVLDKAIFERVKRMLNDYTVTYRGYNPPYYVSDVDINSAIYDVIDHFSIGFYDEEAILEADNPEDFLWALRSRIAHVDLFEKIDWDFKADTTLPSVRMDKERFSDAIIDLLERLSGAGAIELKISTSSNEDWVVLRLKASGSHYDNPLGSNTSRFIERLFALCGGLIQTYKLNDEFVIEIEFLPCKAY